MIDLRPSGHRVPPRGRTTRPPLAAGIDAQRAGQLVRQMRAGDRTAAMLTDSTDPAATLELLRQAVQAKHSVWIGFVDSAGVASRRIVAPVRVAGGVLEGFDHALGGVRRFPLHRITSAAVADD